MSSVPSASSTSSRRRATLILPHLAEQHQHNDTEPERNKTGKVDVEAQLWDVDKVPEDERDGSAIVVAVMLVGLLLLAATLYRCGTSHIQPSIFR